MHVRVNAPTVASAESLRQGLASVFGANCVTVDGSRTGVRLRTLSDALETVTGALNTIEHWLGSTTSTRPRSCSTTTCTWSRGTGSPDPLPGDPTGAADYRPGGSGC